MHSRNLQMNTVINFHPNQKVTLESLLINCLIFNLMINSELKFIHLDSYLILEISPLIMINSLIILESKV